METESAIFSNGKRPTLLFVNDRPTTLSNSVLDRPDIQFVLLRFKHLKNDLDENHLRKTSHLPCFVLDMDASLEKEVERFLLWESQNELKVEFFCNPSELVQETSQAFAYRLHLPSLSPQQVGWVRDKVLMKEKFSELGFRTADYSIVDSHEQIIAFADRHGWPLVIKPRDGFSCINTYLLKNPVDVFSLSLDRKDYWVIEKFLPGKEYECCALIFKGRVLDIYLTHLPAPLLAATDGAINGSISIRQPEAGFRSDMLTIIQDIVDGMALDHGYLHLDFFVEEPRIYTLGEVAFRLAGVEIPANHSLSWGFDIFNALIDIHTNRPPQIEYSKNRFVGDLLLPVKPGRIADLTSLDELLSMKGVIGGRMKVEIGDFVEPRRAAHTSSGYVHVTGTNVEQVELRMKEVLKKFRIETSV